ncbi:TPA: EAL domain-containing protein [Salmonella enterica subsp. enterica serovar Mississippi]|nr:EAL domain-containing protein [Salmonella enterica subsp. enterica serovar Mississippi]HEC7464733.1 EAL domain-containing protein [Salmonella enterica subsp. enterica serovar Mississippi]
MKRKSLETFITGILVIAICLPTGLSIWFAHKQTEKKFVNDVEKYTVSVLNRTDSIVRQSEESLKKSNEWQGKICSGEHQRFMQKIAFTHSYIKEVLWVNKRMPVCSSLSANSSPVPFPPPMRITQGGDYGWYTSVNDLGVDQKMVALGRGNSIVMIDPRAFIDVGLQSNTTIDIALIGLLKDTIFSSTRQLDLTVWNKLKINKPSILQFNNTVYSTQYYPDLNLAIVGWSSSSPLDKAWHKNLWTMVPIGLLLSIILSLGIFRILRRMQSPYYAMRNAIENHEISINYQPIVCLKTERIVGAEALARWQLPDGKYLSPDVFIPLAEQTGLMPKLTELVLVTIFHDLGKWLSRHPELHISLNLSVDDLSSTRLSVLLEKYMSEWDVKPEQIALELTERQFTAPDVSRLTLEKYRKKGHSVYIDDFGTGYSSLSYLQKLPVDILKIDKSFIDNWSNMQLTPHIIEIANTLNLKMVSEGIETGEQRDWLIVHGVQFGQGWLFSKALHKTEFILWSEKNLQKK